MPHEPENKYQDFGQFRVLRDVQDSVHGYGNLSMHPDQLMLVQLQHQFLQFSVFRAKYGNHRRNEQKEHVKLMKQGELRQLNPLLPVPNRLQTSHNLSDVQP